MCESKFLSLADVRDPSTPFEVGFLHTQAPAQGVAVAAGVEGLVIAADCSLFSDGLESGDTGRWSASLP